MMRYGVTGDIIHTWMDEPVKIYGWSHRKYRHDCKMKIPMFLVRQYGEDLARNVVIDHLLADKEEENPVKTYNDPKMRIDRQVDQGGLPVAIDRVRFCLDQIEKYGLYRGTDFDTKINSRLILEEMIGALVAAEQALEESYLE